MTRAALAALATMVLLALAPGWALAGDEAEEGDAEVVTLLSVADYPPYNALDEDGVLTGFEAALADELCARAGLTCRFALAPWDELVPTLLAGEADAIMSAFQATPARRALLEFTDEYIPAGPAAAIALPGADAPGPGSVVGVQRDTLQVALAQQQGWAVVPYDSPAEALEALALGQIAAYVADRGFLDAQLAADPGAFELVIDSLPLEGAVALALAPGNLQLKAALDAALAGIKADGTLDALIASWFGGREAGYQGADDDDGDDGDGDDGDGDDDGDGGDDGAGTG